MNKFEEAFNKASISFDKFKLEEPDYDMLVVQDENDYLEHLKVQSAGLAYYYALAKQIENEYDEHERKMKFRYNEMYSECSDALARAGKKSNVKDVDAFVQSKYEAELKKGYARLSELRSQRDCTNAFLEGWRQKGFVLNSMTQMIMAGLLTPRQAVTEEMAEEQNNQLKTAREILKLKKS